MSGSNSRGTCLVPLGTMIKDQHIWDTKQNEWLSLVKRRLHPVHTLKMNLPFMLPFCLDIGVRKDWLRKQANTFCRLSSFPSALGALQIQKNYLFKGNFCMSPLLTVLATHFIFLERLQANVQGRVGHNEKRKIQWNFWNGFKLCIPRCPAGLIWSKVEKQKCIFNILNAY